MSKNTDKQKAFDDAVNDIFGSPEERDDPDHFMTFVDKDGNRTTVTKTEYDAQLKQLEDFVTRRNNVSTH